MKIYVSRNNQQSGPFEESEVLKMLRAGQLSPNDFGIRQTDEQWQTLGNMFRISAASAVGSGVQNIAGWAKQNLPEQLFVQYKSVTAQLKTYLIILGLLGVLPFLIGLILKIVLPPVALILILTGGILFFILSFLFALVFLINNFRKKKFAAAFNSQGVVTVGGVSYEWDKLQCINFLKLRNQGVHGQGLLVSLLTQLMVFVIRRAMVKEPRQRSLDGAELIFTNGKVILPTTMTNFAEIWDFIEKVPAQPRFDGRYDQNTMAELQRCGLYGKPQNQAAVLSNQPLLAARINQMHFQPAAPVAAKKSNAVWIVAGVLTGGLLLFGVGGTFAAYFLFSASSGDQSVRSNSAPVATNEGQTFPDASPDKKPDFTMTAEEFYRDAGDYTKAKQALARYKDKIVTISGWAYLFTEFDGKKLYFQTSGGSLETELTMGEANKLANIKEGERVKVKCAVADDFGVKLKNCGVLERKAIIAADEKPDFTITAKEYWEQIENTKLSYDTQQKNRAKYFGKILEISGKVRKIRGDGHFLFISDGEWVTCSPNDENKPAFTQLTEGQEVKFKGVDDGISLKHCVIAR